MDMEFWFITIATGILCGISGFVIGMIGHHFLKSIEKKEL